MSDYQYEGGELPLFAEAHRWKAYIRRLIGWRMQGEVLEVGAGLGAVTAVFRDADVGRWVCLEPDARMAELLAGKGFPANREVRVGRLADVDAAERFDVILYVDVLEHIEDDRSEMALAAAKLRPGGVLIVLAPAHAWLYTEFDSAVGHYRRYAKSSLRALTPAGTKLEELKYLDSAGLLASLGNRLLLRSAAPTAGQIRLWDGWMVPVSRVADPLLRYTAGKSVLGVWRKERA